jgi:hypothetical protein
MRAFEKAETEQSRNNKPHYSAFNEEAFSEVFSNFRHFRQDAA